MSDCWTLLGINPEVPELSADTIKRAWRYRSTQAHPNVAKVAELSAARDEALKVLEKAAGAPVKRAEGPNLLSRHQRRLPVIDHNGKRVVVPIIDQNGNRVGVSHRTPEEMCRVDAFVDEDGTVWTPPTAWAYYAACKALREANIDRP